MKRILLAALAACVASSADAEIILDDFTDSAEIRLPDGADRTTTEGVGDLNATRLLKFRPVGPGVRTARADVGLSVPGHYTVDVEDAAHILFVDMEYRFGPTDLTQGGRNDAFFVDFTFAEGTVTTFPDTGEQLQPPGVTLVACCQENVGLLVASFSNSFTSPFPRNEVPYTLVAPFERFGDRGGGGLPAEFTDIYQFELWLVGAVSRGPWEVRIDSIRVGSTSAIPEPNGLLLSLIACGCVLAVRVLRPFFTCGASLKEKS